MKREVIVHKLDESGGEVWAYPGEILGQDSVSIRISAEFDRDSADLGLFTLERGDHFLETFYFNRWYNIFTVTARETGRLKGWYCNIARPARMDGSDLFADDLALDLLRHADGRMQLLDAEEFSALALTEFERQRCRQALDRLRWQMFVYEAPFTPPERSGA